MKREKLILIGASTGGPGHIEKIIKGLFPNFKSNIIIAQHMDAIFFPSMIKRFNEISALDVIQAEASTSISTPSIVFVHKKTTDLHADPIRGLYLQESSEETHYYPSVDSLFSSAAKLALQYDILACLLTGIGDDGAEGMMALKKAGAMCICESEESSIVYGMPKAAKDSGACTGSLSLTQIIAKINEF